MKRNIVKIDAQKCNGCGQCVTACAEGAIAIVDGKARIISETYCDGLGACLGHCPTGAISIEQRHAPAFDHAAVERHLAAQATAAHAGGCPGSMMRALKPRAAANEPDGQPAPSALGNWPVQLHLLSPQAPYLRGADLLIAADCVPFALADFHSRLLTGRVVAIGCPKLDDVEAYIDKLSAIFAAAGIKSVTVAHMEVPCCTGIVWAVQSALERAGKTDLPVRDVTIGIDGEVRHDGALPNL